MAEPTLGSGGGGGWDEDTNTGFGVLPVIEDLVNKYMNRGKADPNATPKVGGIGNWVGRQFTGEPGASFAEVVGLPKPAVGTGNVVPQTSSGTPPLREYREDRVGGVGTPVETTPVTQTPTTPPVSETSAVPAGWTLRDGTLTKVDHGVTGAEGELPTLRAYGVNSEAAERIGYKAPPKPKMSPEEIARDKASDFVHKSIYDIKNNPFSYETHYGPSGTYQTLRPEAAAAINKIVTAKIKADSEHVNALATKELGAGVQIARIEAERVKAVVEAVKASNAGKLTPKDLINIAEKFSEEEDPLKPGVKTKSLDRGLTKALQAIQGREPEIKTDTKTNASAIKTAEGWVPYSEENLRKARMGSLQYTLQALAKALSGDTTAKEE